MPELLRLHLEPEKSMTTRQELQLLRNAFAQKPSLALRKRLGPLLTLDDDQKAVIALLDGQPDLLAHEEVLLGQALLAIESDSGNVRARAAATRALALSNEPGPCAIALALRAKAETRLGEHDAARRTLTRALALDPHNKDACKRMAAYALAADDIDAITTLYDELTTHGVAHSRLFAAKMLAHARRGASALAHDMAGTHRFFSAEKLAPPRGWDNIEQFNMSLAKELLAHPELRYDRYGAASEATWRIDTMPSPSAPLARLLIETISAAIVAHTERCAGSDHPWAAARPDEALLRSWCVITESVGFEHWHVHQFGWLSGSYYVQVPDSIASGDGNEGCVAFGLPEDLAGEAGAAAFGTRVVRPESGLLLLFPSHTYHRTFPHGAGNQRICVAFDVKPAFSG